MRKKALHTAAAVFMAVIVMMMNVSAVFASPGVTITGGDDVKGGETFTVTVKFSGGDIGRVEGSLTYDTDRLHIYREAPAAAIPDIYSSARQGPAKT